MIKLTRILAICLSLYAVTGYADYCALYDFSNLVVTGPHVKDDTWQIGIETVNSKNMVVGGMDYPINSFLENNNESYSGVIGAASNPLLTVKTLALRHQAQLTESWSYMSETPVSCKVDFLPNKCSVLKVSGEIKIIDGNKSPVIVKPLSCEMTYLPVAPSFGNPKNK